MSTFADMQARVGSNAIDIPAALAANIGTYVNRALKTLQNLYNFRVMEAQGGPYTTATGVRTLAAVPGDFKAPRGRPYWVSNLGRVAYMEWGADRSSAVGAFGDGRGSPLLLTESEPDTMGARSILVWPYPDGVSDHPDGQYRVYVPYWRYLPALSAGTDTNWFLATPQTAEFVEALATSYAFFADWDEDRAAVWQKLAGAKLAEAKKADKDGRMVDTLVPHWRGANSTRVRF